MNIAILRGKVGQDPKTSQNGGLTITTLSLGTSKNVKGKDGNYTSQTTWHNIKTFGKTAEVAGKFSKGDEVEIANGEIAYEQYKNKEGQQVKTTFIYANQITRTKKANPTAQPQQRTYNQQPQQEVFTQDDFNLETHQGDLPF